jgi:hypothetical protein
MSGYNRDDDLAYGDYHGQGDGEGGEGERGFLGDTARKFFGGKKPESGQGVRVHLLKSYISEAYGLITLDFVPKA